MADGYWEQRVFTWQAPYRRHSGNRIKKAPTGGGATLASDGSSKPVRIPVPEAPGAEHS